MLKNSNYIVLQVEFNDYSIEYINFDNFKEAQEYYLSNLSQLKLLNIMYKGIKYYKFSDCYIIISQDGTKYTRYSVKDVKECINNYIINNIK